MSINSESSLSWEMAIQDAQALLAETDDERYRLRLELAIEWFWYRIETGTPFPCSQSQTAQSA